MSPNCERFLLVRNPHARGGAAHIADEVAARIHGTGAAVDVFETAAPDETDPVPGLADTLSGHRSAAVVVVGGDGSARTVAEVVSRHLGTWPAGTPGGGTSPGTVPITIVPGGTGNSMFRALWGDVAWQQALGAVLEGRAATRPIDLYRIVETDRAVLLGASTGFFRWTLDATARFPELTGRELYTAAGTAVAQELVAYRGRVEVDDVTVADGPIMLAAVGGAAHRSGTIHVLPGSELDDGRLDVCVLAVGTREEFFALMGKVVDGAHGGEPGVVLTRGRRVVLASDSGDLPFEHDGEIWREHTGRVTIDVVPAAIDVTCPGAS